MGLQDAVNSRTTDGRSLRRTVLKGAVMVFVTAGYSGKRFIFEKAKELGIRSVVLDGPDRYRIPLESFGRKWANKFRCCYRIRRGQGRSTARLLTIASDVWG